MTLTYMIQKLKWGREQVDDDGNKYRNIIKKFVASLQGKAPTFDQMVKLLSDIGRTTRSLKVLRNANKIGITARQRKEWLDHAEQGIKDFIANWDLVRVYHACVKHLASQ